MKIAYLVSQYPAVSHTFILREIASLREQEIDIGTFSVRRPARPDPADSETVAEASRTRPLFAAPPRAWLKALCWAVSHRPLRTCRTLASATLQAGMPLRQRARWGAYFLEATLLARWLVQGRFEHLHCHFGNSGASTGMLAAALAGIPFSLTCHGSELLEPHRHRLERKVAQAAFAVCVSRHGKAQLMLACPPSQWTKIHVVHCAAPRIARPGGPDAIAGPPPASQHVEAGTDLLCVGRLSPEKGHLVLLEALALLNRQGRRLRCDLVGDGPMRGAIQQRRDDLGQHDTVRLLGSRPAGQVLALYPRARLAVLASFREGIPVVLMEAMACGCPVVATWVGGVSELIRDGVSGRLVPPADPRALAEAIAWMLDHPRAARAMAQEARAHVATHFSRQTSTQELIRLFHARPVAAAAPLATEEETIPCPAP